MVVPEGGELLGEALLVIGGALARNPKLSDEKWLFCDPRGKSGLR